MIKNNRISVEYFRNFIFGVEDSLVSTVGLLSGVAVAGTPKETIFITGVVLILVEAFSMSAGSLLSGYSAESYETKVEKITKTDIVSSIIMFFSYFVSGFISLFPYILFPVGSAFYISICLSVICLFILGIVGAKIAKIRLLKNAMRMVMVGGIAILVGVVAGGILK